MISTVKLTQLNVKKITKQKYFKILKLKTIKLLFELFN